jgi:hypothetical protein
MKNFIIILISVIIGIGIGIGIMSVPIGKDCEITGKLLHKSANHYLVIELSENQTAEYHVKEAISRPLLQGKWYTFTYRYKFFESKETITKAIAAEAPPER